MLDHSKSPPSMGNKIHVRNCLSCQVDVIDLVGMDEMAFIFLRNTSSFEYTERLIYCIIYDFDRYIYSISRLTQGTCVCQWVATRNGPFAAMLDWIKGTMELTAGTQTWPRSSVRLFLKTALSFFRDKKAFLFSQRTSETSSLDSMQKTWAETRFDFTMFMMSWSGPGQLYYDFTSILVIMRDS